MVLTPDTCGIQPLRHLPAAGRARHSVRAVPLSTSPFVSHPKQLVGDDVRRL